MKQRDEFDDWLVAMDDKLEQLMEDLPEELGTQLDYSPASLSSVEAWLLKNFATKEDVIAKDRYLLDRLSCYVGETFRKALNGTWSVDLEDGDNVYYGLPVIEATLMN